MAYHILVAEDTFAHAKVLRLNLMTAGYEVTVANDGHQAWLASQREQFDLVITDYKMPYVSGLQLCRLLRQDERYGHTPIILVSSFYRELDLELLRARFDLAAIFEKPCIASELVTKVAACLDARTAVA